MQEKANQLSKEIGRIDPKEKHLVKIGVAAKPFNRYLYESNGITLTEIEFEMVLASSEYMFRKPNKEIFELALLKADLKLDEVWYIGDEYQSDCVGAVNAGIYPIWYLGALDFEQDLEQDVLKIHHWNELKEMMGGKL